MLLKVTEYNSTKADILIGFYPSKHFTNDAIAHAYGPDLGDIHIRADYSYSAFSSQGREFKMHGLFKVVCLSMCLCLLAYLSVCMSVGLYVCLGVFDFFSLLCRSICPPAYMSACMFIYVYVFIYPFVWLCLSGCLFCLSTHPHI